MIGDNDEVASLCEVSGLLKPPDDGEGFTLEGGIALFCKRQEVCSSEGDLPAYKSLTVSRYFGSSSIVVADTLKPVKSTLFSAN